METLKVAIADDHPIVPVGYESGLSVANAFALMEYLTRHLPNVLVPTALYSPVAKGK